MNDSYHRLSMDSDKKPSIYRMFLLRKTARLNTISAKSSLWIDKRNKFVHIRSIARITCVRRIIASVNHHT